MANSTIRVTGFIGSKNGITLFHADGTSEVLPQDGYRTKEILKRITGPLMENPGVPVEVDLEEFALEKRLAEIGLNVTKEGDKTVIQAGDTKIETNGQLDKHIEQAAFGHDATGFKLFMEDFAKIPHKHSATELLDFMKRGDLPIADDGSILVYKYLTAQGPGVFVDTHTKRVTQKLGSVVQMPIEKVNDDRRTLCATGLHVCSNQYGSYGESVFIAKVRPSDVIAVPIQESGKMRVAKYHLVAKLDDRLQKLVANKSSALDDGKGASIVKAVIAGEHVGILETVTVNGSVVVDRNTAITSEPGNGQAEPSQKQRDAGAGRVKLVKGEKISPKDIKKMKSEAQNKAKEFNPKDWRKFGKHRDRMKNSKTGEFISMDDYTNKVNKAVADAAKAVAAKTAWPKDFIAKAKKAQQIVKDAKKAKTKVPSLRDLGKAVGADKDRLSKYFKEIGFSRE